jgi:uroporphyrinogen-III decarboxylase
MFEIHTSLGCVATEINEPAICHKHYKRLQEMTKRKYSNPQSEEDCDALMVSDNEMGIAEMMMGKTLEAWTLFEKAQNQASRFRDSSETAKSIYFLASANLGLAQWINGDNEKASYTLMQAWKYHEDLISDGKDTGFA